VLVLKNFYVTHDALMSQRNADNRTEIPCEITGAAFLLSSRKEVKSRQPDVEQKKNRNKNRKLNTGTSYTSEQHAGGSWKFC
jgi:hypothetical protein